MAAKRGNRHRSHSRGCPALGDFGHRKRTINWEADLIATGHLKSGISNFARPNISKTAAKNSGIGGLSFQALAKEILQMAKSHFRAGSGLEIQTSERPTATMRLGGGTGNTRLGSP